jgi:hypothetical protein
MIQQEVFGNTWPPKTEVIFKIFQIFELETKDDLK